MRTEEKKMSVVACMDMAYESVCRIVVDLGDIHLQP